MTHRAGLGEDRPAGLILLLPVPRSGGRVAEPVLPDRRDAAYDRAQRMAGVALWSLEVRSGRLRVNGSARAVLGWPESRVTATPQELMDGVHPEDRERALGHLQALIATGAEFTIEHRIVRADGSTGYLRACAAAARDADGSVVAVHGVSTDVTAQRLAAQALELERDRSRAVLSSISEGYLLMREGVIVEVNEAVCAMTGFSADELLGTGPPYPYWPPEAVAELGAVRADWLRAGHGVGEFTAARKDGAPIRVMVTARLLTAADGPALWLVVLRDITAQRAREADLTEQAASDPLTGVHNSRTFRRDLHDAVRASDGSPLSLALVDVDHFKSINDRFGHAVGDEVLIAVVERLRASTADAGELARVGGEEFALLMPGLTAEQAHRVLERALRDLAAGPIGDVGRVTASAGVAELLDGMTDDALYRLTDTLLYEAKARGRNQVR